MNPQIARAGATTSWRYDNDIVKTPGFYYACRWALRVIVALLLCATVIALTGCNTPLQVPKEVKVQVPVPCIASDARPARPELLSDAAILGLDSYRATWALWGDRLERQAYETKLEAVVEGCSRIPATSK